jgi:hypothetical protein
MSRPEPVALPDDEGVPVAQSLQSSVEPGTGVGERLV